MDKLKVPDKALIYVEALRELIRTGAMAAPTLESSCLIDLPVVLQRCGANASPPKRAYTFIKILQQVSKQRLEGKDAETACILFGFEGYAGVPIQDRYRAVAKLYSPHWTWENYRKEPLTRHLLAVYLALEREAELDSVWPHFGHKPKQARSGLVGQDWVLERFEGLYTFPAEAGQPLEVLQTRQLRATCDSINVWRHQGYVRERGVSAVPQISLFGPGKVSVIDTHVDNASGMRIYITEVTFPEPLRYGQSIEFTLLKRVNAEWDKIICKEGWDWYGLVTLASAVEHARVGLRFSPHKQPRAVWRYEDIISGLVRPGIPTNENRLTIDSTGFVSCSWSDLAAGYSYGIALDW